MDFCYQKEFKNKINSKLLGCIPYEIKANSIKELFSKKKKGEKMLFSSITSLYYFLPVVLILYNILPKKVRNIFLLAVNLIFYAYGEPVYVLLMIASIVINYSGALIIDKTKDSRQRKLLLAVFLPSAL